MRVLTEEKCGKIAEKCEPRENLDAFRNAHRLNVGEALNKFIFGNAQLYTNNFVNIEQCKDFNNWNREEHRNGEHNYSGIISKGYSNNERRITPGVIQPQFSEIGQSKKSTLRAKPYTPTRSTKPNNYSLYRIKNKRRPLLTKSPKNTNHTNTICRLIANQYATTDYTNIPSFCKNSYLRESKKLPSTLTRNLTLNFDNTNFVKNSNLIDSHNPELNGLNKSNRNITEMISFKNLTSILLNKFISNNFSKDKIINSYYKLPIQNLTGPFESHKDESFLIRNNLTNVTKFDEALLDTSSKNDDVWVLENNEIITEDPIFFDQSLQQPLKSKGMALNMAPFLRLGELGIIMYQIINGAF